MKAKSSRTLLLSLVALLFVNQAVRAQQPDLLQGFSLKVSPGALFFYGDMSQDDYNPFKKIPYGSRFGIGLGVIKQFTPYLGVQAQFVAGNLYSKYEFPDNPAGDNDFSGSLVDFSFSARFDPIYLFKEANHRWSPYLSAGIASVGYRSVRRNVQTNEVILPVYGYLDDGVTRTSRLVAMSVPLAVGLSYQFSPSFQLELEHSVRMTNTDILDCYKGLTHIQDYYALTSIGLRYTIGASKPTPKAPVIQPVTEPVKPKDEGLVAKVPLTNLFVDCVVPETVTAGQSFDVKVRINKSEYKGEAKLIQKFDEGFLAEEVQSAGGVFGFFSQTAVVEWNQMPADSVLLVSYKVETARSVTGSHTISGRLEYMQPEGLRVIRFNKTYFVNPAVAEPVQEPAKTKTDETTKTVGQGTIRPSVGLAGIEFRVQCGAFRDSRQAPSQLAAKYGIRDVIQEEYIDGWYKYTVGSFRTYDEAAKYRDQFIKQTKITSAFIVAYRDGKRLANINEALR